MRGSTAHNRDCMFIDHRKLGYLDGDGPGKQYILDGGSDETDVPRSWVPIITVREDNTTCISTNLAGKNGQMKELERAFGVYVSWNCARLNSGDYETLYTRSHDMTADISTKGFDDAPLYARLSLLMNLYSPQQWLENVLRPLPMLADKSSALEDPAFDENALNSQWVISSM